MPQEIKSAPEAVQEASQVSLMNAWYVCGNEYGYPNGTGPRLLSTAQT